MLLGLVIWTWRYRQCLQPFELMHEPQEARVPAQE